MNAGELPALIRALLDPQVYPHAPAAVELRQTHISYVLLAGDRVYKIKKPLALGFLDFTTLARRAYYCRQELALNRRMAPSTYLNVVPIVEDRHGVRLGGPGRPREWAVEMRRLPENGMLTQLLARGEATPELMARIAAQMAAFHATAAAGPAVARNGRPAAVRQTVVSNLRRVAPFVGRTIERHEYAHLLGWTDDFLAEQRALLLHRARSGRIRDGHGDLHAASICVDGDAIVFFDCIEFSSRLRRTDVAAEVAFLAMDLDRAGRADLAAAFVRAYETASGDPELRALLPFYQAYRAEVRGLVTSLTLDQPDFGPQQRTAQAAVARGYFDLAQYAYTGGAPRPLLLLIGGLPASGKSTLAQTLAGRLALVPLNSDVVRKQRAGVSPTARRAAAYGEDLYSADATAATYTALLDAAREWLTQGVSVALDASFRQAGHRAQAIALAESLGVPWLAIECGCPPAATLTRLAARAQDATAVSDADWAVRQQIAAEWEPWSGLPDAHHLEVDTTQPPERLIANVLARVAALPA